MVSRLRSNARSRPGRHLTPLFSRVLVTNTLVLFVAPLASGVLAASGGRFATGPALGAAVPLLVMWIINFYLLRGAFAPLSRLSEFADRVDLLHPGRRLQLKSSTAEVVVLTHAVNRMLVRLEQEQRSSTRRAVAAQEAERKRIAQELHDQVGQALTAVLLELDQAARLAPVDLRERLERTLEEARSSLEDIRRIAVELRPETLDELGLPGALITLCDRFGLAANVHIDREVQHDLRWLTEEQELAIYRIAQEALTNVVRHSGSRNARLSLSCANRDVSLEVIDTGDGLRGAAPSTGVMGMRERANLVGAHLSVDDGAAGGTIVRLILPSGIEAPYR
jgi:two-component system sensor histidine kinase UhpB